MATLSVNEIRTRAGVFCQKWANTDRENAEKQTFWNEFFEVFGRNRRQVATFEEPVKKIKGKYGSIDLFWPSKLIVEHKSAGQDLDKAKSQAYEYALGLINEGRENEVPRYIIVSDFKRIALHDLEPETKRSKDRLQEGKPSVEFPLADLPKHLKPLLFMAGYQAAQVDPEDPANEDATKLMCALHDALEDAGTDKHELKRMLVRILFCNFADDTDIFPPDSLRNYLEERTSEDGSDLGPRLEKFFETLDTPQEKRSKNLDEALTPLPYVNGALFRERLPMADFNSKMREALIQCTHFQWERISPAVFGSLFQSVMDSKERRQIGAHYTSEENILKVINPLFLDDLKEEFTKVRDDKSNQKTKRLNEFLDKLTKIKILDPACGCGNFLVIAYRELRLLELEALKEINHGGQREFTLDDVNRLSRVDVDQMHGIEFEEFPALIAEVAIWLVDHQMNQLVSEAFGQSYQRIPLRKNPKIRFGNALRTEWNEVLPKTECTYVIGNPPFVGGKLRKEEQKEDMEIVAKDVDNGGLLDYVCGWYLKAAEYILGTKITVAFVSTNSITQGEQVGVLWNYLFEKYAAKIHFAYRPFKWISESRGKAHVTVVIVGWGLFDEEGKKIYETDEESHISYYSAKNISPYLVEGKDIAVMNRNEPICPMPTAQFGCMPNDDGNFLFEDEEMQDFIKEEPASKKYFKEFLSAREYINGKVRWCLWLQGADASEIRKMPHVIKRIDNVKKLRLDSKRAATRKLAETPSLFGEIRTSSKEFVLIPRHSSEKRNYIPFSYYSADYIPADSCIFVSEATLFEFGILISKAHMDWVRAVCGRLESRYRYSVNLVYHNFPWPQANEPQKKEISELAKNVLQVREHFLPPSGKQTMADLYDPLAMPADLLKAHQKLDAAVDKAYRKEPFKSARERVEFLFKLHSEITEPMNALAAQKPKRKAKAKK
jgi:uncharacterized membrane protein (Fun14 family)